MSGKRKANQAEKQREVVLKENKDRPNILLIQDDQHHAGLMSCAGHPDVKTPNIDRIAAGGIRFANCFCPSAICQASRVAMFTGQTVHTTGDYENSGLIRPDLYSLVGHLAANGYQTATLGKMHFVPQWPGHGFEIVRAGDFSDCVQSAEENEYLQHVRKSGMESYYDLLGATLRWGELGAFPSRLPLELSQEHWLSLVTAEFLETRDRARPFFCHASFSRPHNPWSPSAPFHEMYDPASLALPPTNPDDWKNKPFNKRDRWHDPKLIFYYPNMTPQARRRALALYYGLISQVDYAIGRILDTLDRLGLADNTIIVFCSDHGELAGEHGIVDKGVPTLDSIWRVPLLITDPRPGSPRGDERNQLVNLIDLMPTLLERAGVSIPKQVEGCSLTREISEAQWSGRDAVFFEYRHVKSVRTRDYAMSYYSPGEDGFRSYDHSSTWARGGELYDLREDPGQFHNVFDNPEYLQTRLRLTEMILEWFCNTERVHRLDIAPCKGNPACNFDHCGMSHEAYRKHYFEGHPFLKVDK